MAAGHLSRTKEGEVEATRAPTPPVVSLGLLRMLADDRWGQRDSPGATRLNPVWLTEGSRRAARGGERTLTGLTHMRVATGAEGKAGTRGPAVGATARRQSQGMGQARGGFPGGLKPVLRPN